MLMRFAATVGSFTMLSRILGFVRDIMIASFLGASSTGDAFFIAFKFPNLFRRLFSEGAFSLAFVPLFAEKLESDGRRAARFFAEDALAILLWVLLIIVVVAQVLMPWLILLIAPGFADDPAKLDLTVYLARLTFPYLLFISIVSLLGGVLNSLERFAAAAAAPILLNLCLIGSLLAAAKVMETPAHSLAWGVALAGVIQFLWLVWNCKRAAMLPSLPFPRITPEIKKLLVLMLPAALGAGVMQLNLVVDMIIASFLQDGSVSHLYYADRLVQLPLGVIGVAIGTALLPTLARQIVSKETDTALHSQNRAIEYALLFTLPAAAAFMVIGGQIIHVLFERGAFDAAATGIVTGVLFAYAVGLPAFVLVKVLAPAYFARQNPRVPLRAAVFALLVNVILNLALMRPFGVVGIAIASAIASWVNVFLLTKGLFGDGYFRPDRLLVRRLPRMLIACVVMVLVLLVISDSLSHFFDSSLFPKALTLLGLVLVGVGSFALVAGVIGAARWRDLQGVLRR